MADPTIDIPAILASHARWLRCEPGTQRANLSGADLPTGFRVASLCFGGWPVTVTPSTTTIGCREHPNTAWLAWSVDAPEIAAMHANAAEWWRRHREAVCAVIRDVMQEANG